MAVISAPASARNHPFRLSLRASVHDRSAGPRSFHSPHSVPRAAGHETWDLFLFDTQFPTFVFTFPQQYFDTGAIQTYFGIVNASTVFFLGSYQERIGRPWTEGDVEKGTWEAYCHGKEISGPRYVGLVASLNQYARKMVDWWEGENGFDLLVSPTMSAPPPRLGHLIEDVDVEERFRRLAEQIPYTLQFNVTGQPAISLPLHWTDDGLPIWVHFVAKFANEALLIRLAAQLEESMPWADKRPRIVAAS